MKTMDTTTAIDITMRQTMINPDGRCKVCQRTGLPILLLRSAYAPEPGDLHLQPGAQVLPMRLGQPRTLRHGYVYVMLDRQEWQAYQVTPEGALRQFRPYQPPRTVPPPLSRQCVAADHDIPAAFINIDTQMFSTAWIAFSNDPWSDEVLNRYLTTRGSDGADLSTRFHQLDLKAARDNPASVGLAMTEQDLQLRNVLEYAEVTAGNFTSVHGFYSRNHRLTAMRGHVRTLIQREKLDHGILALVLPDPVGVVQETNAQRAACFTAMQEWRAAPQRRFEMFTSQALLGIRQLQDVWAAQEAAEEAKAHEQAVEDRNNYAYAFKTQLPPVDVAAETKRRIAQKQDEARERLEQRYDEGARAAFEQEYLREHEAWQKLVDRVGEVYVQQFESRAFQLAVRHDYDTTWSFAVGYFILMMSACLSGGPSEVPPQEDAALGATQRLWQNLLEDRDSLLYQALLAKDKALIEQLAAALTGDDLGRVYSTLRTTISSMEGQDLMVKPVREAIGQLLAATANASNVLAQKLAAHTQTLIGHMHSAALLRYAGHHVTQIVVSLRLGEYLTLLNEALQERTDAFLAQLDEQFRKPAQRKVRAMVLSGAIAIAVPSNHGKLVDITLWSLESAEALQARLEKLRVSASSGVPDAVRKVSIGAASLQGGAAYMLLNLNVGAANALSLAKDAMQTLRNPSAHLGAGKFDLLLSLGSLWFQQDGFRKSYEALANVSEDEKPEALAAVWSSSMGLIGFGVEIAGFTTQTLRPDLTTMIRIKGQTQTIALGTRIAQYGIAIVAITSMVDAVQSALAMRRTASAGDNKASRQYQLAALLSVGATVAGTMGAFAVQATLLGPIGLAVLLGLAAYAASTLARTSESTPLEAWARHSRWGKPEENSRWKTADDLDTAICELNAAVLGMTAKVDINLRFQRLIDLEKVGNSQNVMRDEVSIPTGLYLDYRIILPNFDSASSRYIWALTVHRAGTLSSQVIISGPGFLEDTSAADARQADYDPRTVSPLVQSNETLNSLSITGAIALSDGHSIHAIDLSISYWPDSNDESGSAHLVVRRDKLDTAMRPWK